MRTFLRFENRLHANENPFNLSTEISHSLCRIHMKIKFQKDEEKFFTLQKFDIQKQS